MDEPALENSSFWRVPLAALTAVAGWAVPGLGHILLRRWIRGCVYFCSIALMALTGYWLRGDIFSRHPTDAFNFLGFMADFGMGIFYFLAHRLEASGPDISRAWGEWGTRFLATAGVLNMLCILDAIEIALSGKDAGR